MNYANMSPDQTRKSFLIGTVVLSVLIVVGLVWAVASGPGPGSVFRFDDKNNPAIGAVDAKLVVQAYGDFQCPACKAAEAGFQYAVSTYKDRVKFIWNDFPLQSLHPNALPAANAARCAGAQGKFWEMHDKLYVEQSSWDKLPNPDEAFLSYGMGVGVQKDQFAECLKSRSEQSKVMDDLSEGERNGVNGTPTYFIGNKRVSGILTNAQWDQEITSQLAQ